MASRFARTAVAALLLSMFAIPAMSVRAEAPARAATAAAAGANEAGALRQAQDAARKEGLGKIEAGSTARTIAKAGWVIFVLGIFITAALIAA
ncbi:MAG: hypothetical protein AAB215_00435 [Planctomycetota bacterium]